MKIQIALLAGIGLAVAHPSRHARHAHHHDARAPSPVADVVSVPGPTVITYELNGQVISQADVQEGIKNGSLIWADGAPQVQSSSSASVALNENQRTTPKTSTSESAAAPTTSATSSYVAPSTTSEAASTSSASSTDSAASSASSSSSQGSVSSTGVGIDTAFPDASISCSDFPQSYGAVYVDYMGLGGWIGIQNPGSGSGGFSNIETVEASQCSGSNCCAEGSYCSYACPPGYQKSQWPSTQGSTGQSVGGLLCQNGVLHLTNSDLSSNLCIPGTDAVTVLVQNEMSDNVAVCRTDYPGKS